MTDSRSYPGSEHTCYIERSRVRQILIASDDGIEGSEVLLREVDALPIRTAEDFRHPAQRPSGQYGKHRVTHNGVVLECDYFVPGLTVHDLTMIFERATKTEGVSETSGNPANWPSVRGVMAVAEAVASALTSTHSRTAED